ncbi:MAG TPA: response regulator [Bdellovibrionota bacterium]|jgi:adenylate cyclase|nr:response regulator [Bdellovibrionota bacterium]
MSPAQHTAVIIDDDPHLRSFVTSILAKAGISVHQAESVAKSIEAVAKHKPKLVICDLNMPEDSGFIFLDMREEHPFLKSLPVLIVTARKDKEAFEKAMSYANTDFLVKPLDPQDLIDKAKKLLGV